MPRKKGSKKNKHWAKFRFEVIRKEKGKQKFFWRAVSCNGNTVCHAEMFVNENSPRKTIDSLIDAIKKGQYKIVEDLVHE
jgi:uncharacterized protein YegP (UPF0339 family)